jgi:ferrous iron transport protein B
MGTIYSATEKVQEFQREEFVFTEALARQYHAFAEAILSSLSSLTSFGVRSLGVEEEEFVGVKETIANHFSPLSALSFMIFILIYTSCLGTFAVMVQEVGKLRGILFLGYSFILAWMVSFLVYRIGGLLL